MTLCLALVNEPESLLAPRYSMLFHEWKDIVTYPGDSNRIRSREERLDTRNAFRPAADGSYPAEMFQKPIAERAAVITLPYIQRGDDVFECMAIDDYGYVLIWTRDKVWFLAQEGIDDLVEKLRCLPRHPVMLPKSSYVRPSRC